jgi:glycosyltransferase involved in cell wall biosynthesis
MLNPQVTAILPCFNHEQYLEERIRSVLSQTHPVSQIIFLDDASTDSSVDRARVLLSNSSAEVIFDVNAENSGSPFVQWNRGVALAKHPLIWIAETDDSCMHNILERLYTSIIDNQSVLSFTQSRYISSDGRDLGSASITTSVHWPQAFLNDFVMEGLAFNSKFMSIRNSIPNASAVLFSKQAYLASGGANPSLRLCGDWDLWSRLSSFGTVSFVSDELNYFRCHSLTTRSFPNVPLLAAESLACRLNIFLTFHPSATSTINPLYCLRHIRGRSSDHFFSIVYQIRLFKLLQTAYYYHRISDHPHITPLSWIIIFFILVFHYMSNTSASTIPSRVD